MKAVLLMFCFVIGSYLIGSLPVGYVIGKLFRGKNFDIRNFGSGNIGMTNCLRSIGPLAGLIVFFFDVMKGYLPTIFAKGQLGEIAACLCMVGAIIGHGNSLYFKLKEGKFDGGKMVATALGGIIGLNPAVAGSAFLIWLVIVLITRYVSLASIIAAPSTLLLAWAFHASPTTYFVLTIAAVYIIYKHRRNINRLITKTEPKIGEDRSDVTVAFFMHPRDIHDYAQNELTEWIEKFYKEDDEFSDKMMDQIVKKGFVFEAGEISGVATKTGLKIKILLFGIPMLPYQLKKAVPPKPTDESSDYDPRYQKALNRLLWSSVKLAKQRGASAAGLGGHLSSCATNGGEELQKEIDKWNKEFSGLEIVVGNGGTYTTVSAIQALEMATRIPLSKAIVAVVGAKGFIGHLASKWLSKIIPLERLIAVSRKDIKEIEELAGSAKLGTSENLDILKDADVVVLATSSVKPIISEKNKDVIKQDALVLDIGFPENFDSKILEERSDINVVRCGLVRLPGQPKSRVNIHFGFDPDGCMLVPACLAETVMVGIAAHLFGHEEAHKRASRGYTSVDNMEFFKNLAEEVGFEVRISADAEPAVFARK